jgi:hypothetical protein
MIRYRFAFADGSHAEFCVDERSSAAPPPCSPEGLAKWMDLDTHRCSHCPLTRSKRMVCPAFEAIFSTIKSFDHRVSSDACDLTVERNDVTYSAHTSIQNAARSLIGLQLALSGCPTMRRLRPLARFHMPLADTDETIFRVFGMHMLTQYFRHANGEAPDWSLAELQSLYKDIHQVNCCLANRIRAASHKDAAVNGLVILDSFAHEVEYNIETKLEQLAPYFASANAPAGK